MGDCGPAEVANVSASDVSTEQLKPSKAAGGKRLPLPEVVFGREVVGRKIKTCKPKSSGKNWEEAKVKEFDPSTGHHRIRFSDSTDVWICLGSTRFHWIGKASANAEPNSTYYSSPKRETAVGKKLKLYWPAMNKWYTGVVKSFNPDSDLHRIDYMDGDSVEYSLKHEAVVWLDSDSNSKSHESGQCVATDDDSEAPQVKGGKHNRRPNSENALSNGSSIENAPPNLSPGTRRQHKKESATDRGGCGDEVSTAQQTVVEQAPVCTASSAPCTSGVLTDRSSLRVVDHSAVNLAASADSLNAQPAQTSSAGKLLARKVVSRKVLAAKVPEVPKVLATTVASVPDAAAPRKSEGVGQIQSSADTSARGRKRSAQDAGGISNGKRTKRIGAKVAGPVSGGCDCDDLSSAIGSRVGIYWEGDETYYRAKLVGHDSKTGKYEVRYDDGVLDWLQLEKEAFRWYTPRGQSAGYRSSLHQLFLRLGAGNIRADTCDHESMTLPKHEAEPPVRPEDAISRRVSVYWPADGNWYSGEVLAYNVKNGLYHVLYMDGEDEWLSLREEYVTWYKPARHTYTSAGLCSDETIPSGRNAIGWRVAIYWKDDMVFYDARIIGYDNATGRHQVLYNDSQSEVISLHGEKIIWKLPPSVGDPVEGLKELFCEDDMPAPRETKRARKRSQNLDGTTSAGKSDSALDLRAEEAVSFTKIGRPRKLKAPKPVAVKQEAANWAAFDSLAHPTREQLSPAGPRVSPTQEFVFSTFAEGASHPLASTISVVPSVFSCEVVPQATAVDTSAIVVPVVTESQGVGFKDALCSSIAAVKDPAMVQTAEVLQTHSPARVQLEPEAAPSCSLAIVAACAVVDEAACELQDTNAGAGQVAELPLGNRNASLSGLAGESPRPPAPTQKQLFSDAGVLKSDAVGTAQGSRALNTDFDGIDNPLDPKPVSVHIKLTAGCKHIGQRPASAAIDATPLVLLRRRLDALDEILSRITRAETELGFKVSSETPALARVAGSGSYASGQRMMIAPTTAKKSIRVTLNGKSTGGDKSIGGGSVQNGNLETVFDPAKPKSAPASNRTYTAARPVVKRPTVTCLNPQITPQDNERAGNFFATSTIGPDDLQYEASLLAAAKHTSFQSQPQRFGDIEIANVYDSITGGSSLGCIHQLADGIPGDDLTPAEIDDLLMDIDPKDDPLPHDSMVLA